MDNQGSTVYYLCCDRACLQSTKLIASLIIGDTKQNEQKAPLHAKCRMVSLATMNC